MPIAHEPQSLKMVPNENSVLIHDGFDDREALALARICVVMNDLQTAECERIVAYLGGRYVR